jgi:hypothetical protein
MKYTSSLVAIAAILFISSCSPVVVKTYSTYTPPQEQPQPQPQPEYTPDQYIDNYQVFYDQLSNYGQWINYPDYGYVWQPNVDGDFRPYVTNGQWVYSDYGWTWASNYDWGWAVFHYGRWFYDDNYGWLWTPGHEWAPAWVTWGQSGGYYGWAPIAPRVNVSNGSWRPADRDWNFVDARHINQTNVNTYVVHNNVTVVNNVTIINNRTTNNTTINNNTVNNNTTNNYVTNNKTVVYNRGPQVSAVENAGNVKIQTVKISATSRPGGANVNNGQVSIYKPVVSPAKQSNAPAAPQNVQSYKKGNQQNGGYKSNPNNPQQNNPNRQPVNPQGNNPAAGQNQQPVQQNNQNRQPNQQQGNNNPVNPYNNGQNQQPVQQNNPNGYGHRNPNNPQGGANGNNQNNSAVTTTPLKQVPNTPPNKQPNTPVNGQNNSNQPAQNQGQPYHHPVAIPQGNNQPNQVPVVKPAVMPPANNKNKQQKPKGKPLTKADSLKMLHNQQQ